MTNSEKDIIDEVALWMAENMPIDYRKVWDGATEPDGTFMGGWELEDVDYPEVFEEEEKQSYFEESLYAYLLREED